MGATGNVGPAATIGDASTGLNNPNSLAFDALGQLYVSNTITIYAAGATGNAAPTATIGGTNTGLNLPSGMTF